MQFWVDFDQCIQQVQLTLNFSSVYEKRDCSHLSTSWDYVANFMMNSRQFLEEVVRQFLEEKEKEEAKKEIKEKAEAEERAKKETKTKTKIKIEKATERKEKDAILKEVRSILKDDIKVRAMSKLIRN